MEKDLVHHIATSVSQMSGTVESGSGTWIEDMMSLWPELFAIGWYFLDLTNLEAVSYDILTLSQTRTDFYLSEVQVFLKHYEKKGNCSSRAISPFPSVLFTHLDNFLLFSSNFKLLSADSFSLEESKIRHQWKS